MSKTMYERCMAGEVEECEEWLAETVALCPWVGRNDVAWFRLVLAWHFEMTVGEEAGDLEGICGALSKLAEHAEVAGDVARFWAFDQWHKQVCAWEQGRVYRWPDVPDALMMVV
jgi:hypothetical protein